MSAVQTVLVTILILATSVWVGGYAAIVVVARTTTKTLEKSQRVDFFRAFGRTFLPVGGTALTLVYLCGAVLISMAGWSATAFVALAVAVLLLVVLALGVRQARGLTRMRAAALDADAPAGLSGRIAARARWANALRGLIGVLSLVLVVLGAALAV